MTMLTCLITSYMPPVTFFARMITTGRFLLKKSFMLLYTLQKQINFFYPRSAA